VQGLWARTHSLNGRGDVSIGRSYPDCPVSDPGNIDRVGVSAKRGLDFGNAFLNRDLVTSDVNGKSYREARRRLAEHTSAPAVWLQMDAIGSDDVPRSSYPSTLAIGTSSSQTSLSDQPKKLWR
jgi:hypothetical protein